MSCRGLQTRPGREHQGSLYFPTCFTCSLHRMISSLTGVETRVESNVTKAEKRSSLSSSECFNGKSTQSPVIVHSGQSVTAVFSLLPLQVCLLFLMAAAETQRSHVSVQSIIMRKDAPAGLQLPSYTKTCWTSSITLRCHGNRRRRTRGRRRWSRCSSLHLNVMNIRV